MSDAEFTSVRSKFDTFMHMPFQMAVLGTVETVYEHLALVELNDYEF